MTRWYICYCHIQLVLVHLKCFTKVYLLQPVCESDNKNSVGVGVGVGVNAGDSDGGCIKAVGEIINISVTSVIVATNIIWLTTIAIIPLYDNICG